MTFTTIIATLAEAIPPVVAKAPAYPFIGQKAVKRRLEEDAKVRELTVAMLFCLQTGEEQKNRDTHDKNKAGFMSSDAWHGTKIAEKIIAGEELTLEEQERLDKIALKYSKQLTRQLVAKAMQDDPKLVGQAAIFSITQ